MASLVIAEHDNQSIRGATLNTVTAALACGGEVHVLVAGHNAGAAAQAASQIAGVTKVLHAEGEHFAHGLAENMAAQVLALASNYSHLLFPATASGKNIAPRVAAKLDRRPDLRRHQGECRRHLRAPDLRRQRHCHRAKQRCHQGADRTGRSKMAAMKLACREAAGREWRRKAGAPSMDFVATLPAAVLHPQRLLWRGQIEQSSDRTQSSAVARPVATNDSEAPHAASG